MHAVLHPPNFFAQVAALEKPELRKRPFAVFDGQAPREFVFAANKAARTRGVEVGMSRLQAEACDVTMIRRDVAWEDTAQGRLHEIACRFSPRIELVAARPGTYALDIRGMNTIFGDATQLAAKLRQSVMAAGFLANVAAAENFHVATCLAWGRSGVSVVPPHCDAEAIGALPLGVLPLEPEHVETFKAWGIRTCGELAALAETDLISRMGQVGKKLRALACGTLPHLMMPLEASFESGLTKRMELDCPVDDLQRLLFVLSRMTTELLERVRAKARAIARQCTLCFCSMVPHNMNAPCVQRCRYRTRRRCSSSCNSISKRIRPVPRLLLSSCVRSLPPHLSRATRPVSSAGAGTGTDGGVGGEKSCASCWERTAWARRSWWTTIAPTHFAWFPSRLPRPGA